jgi:hypothetical protein
MKDPKVSQSASAHAAINDESGVGSVFVVVGHGRVRLTWWRTSTVTTRDVPLHLIAVWPQLECVQIIKISKKKQD